MSEFLPGDRVKVAGSRRVGMVVRAEDDKVVVVLDGQRGLIYAVPGSLRPLGGKP